MNFIAALAQFTTESFCNPNPQLQTKRPLLQSSPNTLLLTSVVLYSASPMSHVTSLTIFCNTVAITSNIIMSTNLAAGK